MQTVLCIGGHDPSNGAGITADLQVLQHFKLQCLSVCTGLTLQSHSRFVQVDWVSTLTIQTQVEFLLEEYSIDYVKIGIYPDFKHLINLISILKLRNPVVKIIWDPILSAGFGFEFHSKTEIIQDLLPHISIWTPNWSEFQKTGITFQNLNKFPNLISCISSVEGKADKIFQGADCIVEHPIQAAGTDKRGTGCRYTASLIGYLAENQDIVLASALAQQSIRLYRESAVGMAGHYLKV